MLLIDLQRVTIILDELFKRLTINSDPGGCALFVFYIVHLALHTLITQFEHFPGPALLTVSVQMETGASNVAWLLAKGIGIYTLITAADNATKYPQRSLPGASSHSISA